MKETKQMRVESLASEYGVVTASAIRSYGYLGPFRPRPGVDFRGVRLFDVLLRSDQILCASTVAPGDSQQNLYGQWGAIVGSGSIERAFPYDATTTVVDGEITSIFLDRVKDIPQDEQIASAIHERAIYNEIDVRADSLAGVYYCVDDEECNLVDMLSEQTEEVIKQLNIPVFLLHNGNLYIAEDPSSLSTARDLVEPQDVVNFSIQLSDSDEENLKEYLSNSLVLAPRNAISSGISRGKFAFGYRYKDGSLDDCESFFIEQTNIIKPENRPSLRTYGAVALHKFALEAEECGYGKVASRARKIASGVLSLREFKDLSSRVESSGHLKIERNDLEHYLHTGVLPDYLSDH